MKLVFAIALAWYGFAVFTTGAVKCSLAGAGLNAPFEQIDHALRSVR